jgi:hypothetical protein
MIAERTAERTGVPAWADGWDTLYGSGCSALLWFASRLLGDARLAVETCGGMLFDGRMLAFCLGRQQRGVL